MKTQFINFASALQKEIHNFSIILDSNIDTKEKLIKMSSSVQHSLLRTRPPRVKITYDVEVGNAELKKELPFVAGILADLAGENQENLVSLKDRKFIEIDKDNFDSVLASISPKVTIGLKKDDKIQKFQLNFNSFEEFEPGKIARQLPELNELLNTRYSLVDLVAKLDGNEVLAKKINEIIEKADERNALKNDIGNEQHPYIKTLLEAANLIKEDSNLDFLINLFSGLSKALENEELIKVKDEYSYIINLIAKIDKALSSNMDQILHDENFKKLEASWLGLHHFVFNTETSSRLKLKILPISKTELNEDLVKAIEFDQSELFKKVYENEYGTFGGVPFSCLVGDFSFGRSNFDITLLRNISKLAASAHAPFLGGTNPNFFGIDSFAKLSNPRDLEKVFESSELAAWNSFREEEDSKYINLVLPRVMMRLPYSKIDNPCKEFGYDEIVNGENDNDFCWGNPCYSLAEKITEAFALYSWTAAIRGVEGGGKVTNLPTYTYKTPSSDVLLKCPCQISITDRREKELSDLGFISLCHSKGSDYSVFFGSQSVQKAKKYSTASATANASISARLPYLLNASRFAHYVKMIMRDKIGSFLSAKEVETYLQNWIAEYVLLSDEGSQTTKAQYPLREAKITVIDSPEEPGSYKAIMFLKPHFQMEDLTVSMRLVTNLPTAG